MGVTIKNLGRLQMKLDKLDPLTRAAAIRGVQKGALLVGGAAKMLAPVDTGALRGSIVTMTEASANGATATVGTDLEYAPYVELGTSRAKAQPYLHPGFRKNKDKVTKLITSEIRNAYKGL